MVLAEIEHFLNQEGKSYFPKWIEEVRETVRDFDGFIDIFHLIDPDEPDSTLVLIRFNHMDHLQAWSGSKEHDELIARLDPYKISEYHSKTVEVDS